MKINHIFQAAYAAIAKGSTLDEFIEHSLIEPEDAQKVRSEVTRGLKIRSRSRTRVPNTTKGQFGRYIIRKEKGRELHATKGWRIGSSYGV